LSLYSFFGINLANTVLAKTKVTAFFINETDPQKRKRDDYGYTKKVPRCGGGQHDVGGNSTIGTVCRARKGEPPAVAINR
jgi:hypothetical protein